MSNPLRLLTIICNSGLLITIAFLWATKGAPRSSEIWLVLAFMASPIVSLLYVFSNHRAGVAKTASGLRELAGLEIEARKATLKRRINGEATE